MTSFIPWHEGEPDAAWDASQLTRGAHFLQTSPWAAFQLARQQRVFYASDKDWSWLAILETGRLGKRLYCPYGPTVANAAALEAALACLKHCGKKLRVDFLRVEPRGPLTEPELRALGMHRAHRDIQPRYTLLKDLTQSEDEIFASIAQTNRRLYRRAERLGFRYKATHDPKDLQPFLDMTHEVAKRQHIVAHPDRYYKTMAEVLLPRRAATLFYTLYEDAPVAACFAFETKTTRYYAHAASADSARKLQPGPVMMGFLIFDAKAAGKKQFDYAGIAPPDETNHKWAGLTQFKLTFGGEVVETLGTWELPVRLVRYQAYRFARRVRRR